VRDAENRYFFIDRIKTKTGIELSIIEELEELYVKYVAIKHDIKNFDKIEKNGVFLMNFPVEMWVLISLKMASRSFIGAALWES